MKPILLSADAGIFAYMVPDEVADQLINFCEEFQAWNSEGCFTEVDFINYLNEKLFPETKSWLIEEVGVHRKDIPTKYRDCAMYNF